MDKKYEKRVGRLPAGTQTIYAIYTDQLDTPRMITDLTGNVVWEWDNTDPFGNNLPNQDPNETGNQFVFNLRMSRQYWDVETGTNYNYFRDCYDPATGRYCQSDPIGLYGGQFSTYACVNGNPLTGTDNLGLSDRGGMPPPGLNPPPPNTAGKNSGEAAHDIVDVGWWNTMRAYQNAQDAISLTRWSELPGGHNGQGDAFRHCVWSCLMTDSIGADNAKKVGDNHEAEDNKKGQPANEYQMDTANNANGRACAQKEGHKNCNQECMTMLNECKLWIFDLKKWPKDCQ